ncbi:putative transcriptional regulator, AraC family protein [Planobispora longispora]|uniref:Putative transcriptional regulator, AraC family protein n=1 Tax=Planobispora longispora TaxID=28887 RepID=A0A8J3RUR0_9ACTN|nr:putative transcriptional regulator, AraC family protein [Planobispora longispora]
MGIPTGTSTRLPAAASPGAQVRRPYWAGAATAAPGLLAFTGAIGSAEPHAHAAVQVLLVLDGEVVLTDRHGRQRPVQAAIIPAGVRHGLRATPATHGLLAYLDPASPVGRAATARTAAYGDADAVSTWQAAARPGVMAAAPRSPAVVPGSPALMPGSPAVAPGRAAMRRAAGPHPGAGALPAPLSRALALVPQLIDGPLLLGDLAARSGVSASRLGHLFAEHLHLPYPAWRRWARLLHAVEAVRGGATLTEAAHAAGFADSAHLTRTCRAMFGITPSQALAATGWHSLTRGRR